MPNKFYNQFQKLIFWVDYKRVELDGFRLYVGDMDITIKWYEQIPGIYGSDLVYIIYCGSPSQLQSHTQLVHGKISMTPGTAYSNISSIYKILSP